MHNKLWIAMSCCIFSLPSMANTGNMASFTAKQVLNNNIVQNVLLQEKNHRHPVLPWVEAIRTEQLRTRSMSVLDTPVYGSRTTIYKQYSVSAPKKEQYDLYMHMFQNLLDNHPVFAGYRFRATVPNMLADLSYDGYNFLSGFLEQPLTLWDADPNFLPQHSKLEDAVIQLDFEWTFGTKYILLVDTAKKYVYFFTGEIVK